jgi:predicted enzyme related to lactoylglutathione lyase
MPDGSLPFPGGWNRIELIVEDINAEVDRLKQQGLHFRNEIITGPGGSQILLIDPSGNLIDFLQQAHK